ncbi:MAG: hypothetical protein K1X79_06085 [Oligoflexia bacterium]|nr:hypothetical protein [Oligoflexia bacterium]
MSRSGVFEYVSFCTALLGLGLMVGGTKACQEDYVLGAQTAVTPSASPTDTPEDDGTVKKSPTPTATATVTPTSASTVTVTPTATPTSGASSLILRALGESGEKESSDKSLDKPLSATGSVSAMGKSGNVGNWLGTMYAKDHSAADIDSDGDGFSDALESESGTDPQDPEDMPPGPRTRLADRLRGLDSDYDGLKDIDEQRLGTKPNSTDSDGDGISDGAEVLSGSDPADKTARPIDDQDRDGLSAEAEARLGSSPALADTDSDGLRDDQEAALGTDPHNPDSDGDGILDGKEFKLNGDPLRAEPRS